jgi:hypothetical protein
MTAGKVDRMEWLPFGPAFQCSHPSAWIVKSLSKDTFQIEINENKLLLKLLPPMQEVP